MPTERAVSEGHATLGTLAEAPPALSSEAPTSALPDSIVATRVYQRNGVHSAEDLHQVQAPNIQTAQVLSPRSQEAGIQLSDSAQYAIQMARRARESKAVSAKPWLIPPDVLWNLSPRNSPERTPRKVAPTLAHEVLQSNSDSQSCTNISPSRYSAERASQQAQMWDFRLRNSPERTPRKVAPTLTPAVLQSNSNSPPRTNISPTRYSAERTSQQAQMWNFAPKISPERTSQKVVTTLAHEGPQSNSNSPSRTNISPRYSTDLGYMIKTMIE